MTERMRTRLVLLPRRPRCSRPARRSSARKSRRPPTAAPSSMRVGTPLVVSLPPDPDTGYGWVLHVGAARTSRLSAAPTTRRSPSRPAWSAWPTPRRTGSAPTETGNGDAGVRVAVAARAAAPQPGARRPLRRGRSARGMWLVDRLLRHRSALRAPECRPRRSSGAAGAVK